MTKSLTRREALLLIATVAACGCRDVKSTAAPPPARRAELTVTLAVDGMI